MTNTLFSLTERKDQLRSCNDDSCTQPFINQMSFLGHESLPSAAQNTSRRIHGYFAIIQEDTITASHTNYNYSSLFSGMPMLVCLVNFRAGKKKNTCFRLRKASSLYLKCSGGLMFLSV